MYLRVELLSADLLIIVEEDQLLRHLQLPLKAKEYKQKYIHVHVVYIFEDIVNVNRL